MILCCGEALIDMIPVSHDQKTEAFVPHCGGAVFNTAISLGRLGARAGLLTGLSNDMFGQQLAAALCASHVDDALVIRSDRPSTLAFVRLVNGQAKYSFFDTGSAGRMLRPEDMPALPEEVSTVFFGGISLACEPAADAYAALLDRAGPGRVVMIDPNIRTAFIKDETRYRSRLSSMLAKADIVKVSDEDLNWIIPKKAPQAEKVEKILEAGTSLVIVTHGGEGAFAYRRGREDVHVAAQTVDIVDTVGAGDTFNAGVLARLSDLDLLRKDKLQELTVDDVSTVLDYGGRVAAMTVSRAGANPPWAHELEGAL